MLGRVDAKGSENEETVCTGGRSPPIRRGFFLRCRLLAERSYFQPRASCDDQQFQGGGIQIAVIATVGVNQGCYFVLKHQRQYKHLLVGRAAEVLDESRSIWRWCLELPLDSDRRA